VFAAGTLDNEVKIALDDLSEYYMTGTQASIISNRISFLFDLRGPSLTMDTACSSSLTAVNMAIASLERGDCEAAMVF
jgi:acyl transferase domain-containing protein